MIDTDRETNESIIFEKRECLERQPKTIFGALCYWLLLHKKKIFVCTTIGIALVILLLIYEAFIPRFIPNELEIILVYVIVLSTMAWMFIALIVLVIMAIEALKKKIQPQPRHALHSTRNANNFCKYCGSKIDADASFCSSCGKKLC